MREKIDFCKGWLFHKGDINHQEPRDKGDRYISAKTERYHVGPASKDYVPSTDTYDLNVEHNTDFWSQVSLPHDYVIEGKPEERYNCALGFLPYENAWYIKKFFIDECDRNKRITVFFEGVATHATVYLNGCLIKHNYCGYTSFEADLTDYVKYGQKNTLSVYVSTQEHEGWWYEGGGIYRPVYLIKTDLVSIDLWGIYAKPVLQNDGRWKVEVQAEIRNDDYEEKSVKVTGILLDREGSPVGEGCAEGMVTAKHKAVLKYSFFVDSPNLWSPDSPYRYTLETTVYTEEKPCDIDRTRIGFRTYYADSQKGLFINGKNYKIKGFCGHADCGLFGKAVPDNVHRYKVQLMKEMGANAYRTSHYMQSEALMEALDENGFIVLNETRWFEATDEGKEQLRALVRRDRNRASVLFWSVGNEEPYHITDEGRRIFKTLKETVKKEDDSRMIFTAVSYNPEKATVYEDSDIIGINYNWKKYQSVHERYSDKAILSTECCATGTTRGWYFQPDEKHGFLPAYDRDSSEEFKSREFTWKYIAANDWLMGGYQWIAFEHRGEAVWPRLCSQSGAIDLFMQKKDAYYQNMSFWTTKPMIHLLPHWNFEGMEGEAITVWAYSNVSETELFLNGKSMGKRTVERYGHSEWEVPYERGVLEVKAYENGKVVATDIQKTSGKPHKLQLTLDTKDVEANGKDCAILSCYVTDKDGVECPTVSTTVRFVAEGEGKVYSCGSDITEHDTVLKADCRMRAGRAGVAVKLSEKPGTVRVIAMAEGLETAVLTFVTEKRG